jgi:hypothetical protein
MKRLVPLIALAALAAVAPAARNEQTELESVYRSMSKAFSAKDIRGYSSTWAPAIRWFPPRKASTTQSTKPRAQLLRELRVEFAGKDKVAQDFTFFHFETDPERATVDLAVLITHGGTAGSTRSLSERHHWLKAGGRWWLSRIESVN